MVLRVNEGTTGIQGTVSGTDRTLVSLTNPQEHPTSNILRVWLENPGGGVSTAVTSLNTVTGTTTLAGTDGNIVITDVPTRTITVSGFRTEFVAASGSLQSQIDFIDVDEVEPAIVGMDGITVTSGSSTTTLTGFYPEFVAASGSLQEQFDPIVASSGSFSDSLTVSGLPVQPSVSTAAEKNFSPETTYFPFTHSLNSDQILVSLYVPDLGTGYERQVFFDELYIIDNNTVSGTTLIPTTGRMVVLKGI